MFKYPRGMTDNAQALHRRWLSQDEYGQMASVGSIARLCHFMRADVKQVKAFMAGHCVICELPRTPDTRCAFDGKMCQASCAGYESDIGDECQ